VNEKDIFDVSMRELRHCGPQQLQLGAAVLHDLARQMDGPEFELLMRRFCTASPGEPREKAKAALLAFVTR
jgi:hypothetical protein